MKRLTLFFVGLWIAVISVVAQDRVITGNVSDENGEPLIGVSVVVKGTTTGTVTDLDGNYSLSVPSNAETLVFSYVGYNSKDVAISGQSVISTSLGEGVVLKEVVVTAMGIEKEKKTIGYSIQSVGGDDVVNGRGEKAIEGLQAKVPGLNILSAGGDPGKSSRIVIRGLQSFGSAGGNTPLIVVDGVPLTNTNTVSDDLDRSTDFGGGLNAINPNDIESISVLKGIAASSLYGVRGQNGVIVITTKKGTVTTGERKLNVDFGYTSTFSDVLKIPTFQNTFGQGWEGLADPIENTSNGPKFDGKPRVFGNIVDNQQQLREYTALPTNVKDFYETGVMHNTNLALSGGDNLTNYYFSFSNTKQDGVMPMDYDTYDRNTISLRGSHTHKKLTASSSINYSKSKTSAVRTGQGLSVSNSLLQIPRNISIVDLQDLNNPFNTIDNYFTPYGVTNPYWVLRNDRDFFDLNKFFGNGELRYKASDDFDLLYRFGFDFESYRNNSHREVAIPAPGSPNDGEISEPGNVYNASGERLQLNHDFIATYNKRFNDIISLSAMAGFNANQRTTNFLSQEVSGLDIPGYFNIVNSANIPTVVQTKFLRRILGAYGEIGLSLKDQLYLIGNMRNDWTSTLPEQNRSFFYWGVSSSWIWSELLETTKVVDYAKIRVSYATGGGDADPYNVFPVFVNGVISQPFGNINFPLNGINAYEVANLLGDLNLKPQFTYEYEFGTELSLFKKRIFVDASYYNRITKDQLVEFDLAPETGFTSQYTNFGKIRNRGIELLGSLGLVRDKRGVDFDVFVNFTKNKNKVLELPGGERVAFGGLGTVGLMAEQGKPLGLFESTVYLRNEEGQIVVGNDGLPLLSPEKEIVGDIQYKFSVGVGASIGWKGLKANILFDGRQGGMMYSNTANTMLFAATSVLTTYNDRQPFIIPNSVIQVGEDDNGPIYAENTTPVTSPNITYYWGANEAVQSISSLISKSFFKLREVSLSYTLPTKLFQNIPINNVTVFVAGRNLALWTPKDNPYIDPEATTFNNSDGLEAEFGEYNANPTTRNFSFGVNIGF